MAAEVTIPEYVHDGDDLVVALQDGTEVVVTVPTGCRPGDVITIELPQPATAAVRQPPGPAVSSDVEVTIPPGVHESEVFIVEAASGSFEVTVPAGCREGDIITVMLSGSGSRVSSRRASDACIGARLSDSSPNYPQPANATDADDSESTFRVGQQVEVLRSSGKWQTARVVDYDLLSDLYRVELLMQGEPSGLFKEGVTEAELCLDRSYHFWATRRPACDSSGSDSRSSASSSSSSRSSTPSRTRSCAASDAQCSARR